MKITELNTDFMIKDKGTIPNREVLIYFRKFSDGTITILNRGKKEPFNFIHSNPEMIVKIGRMIARIGKTK